MKRERFGALAVPLAVVSCTALACFPLLFAGFPHGQDIGFELIRLAEYSRGLADGQYPPRWAANLEGGYGFPILNFFPHVFLCLSSVLLALGASYAVALKGAIAGLTLIGGFGTYFFARQHMGRLPGAVASCLFVLAPYHAYDVYARSAFSEFTALMLAPWVLVGLALTLRNAPQRFGAAVLACATALWALSHNLSVLMYAPLFVLYGLYRARRCRGRGLGRALAAVGVALLLVGFYVVPIVAELSFVTMDIGSDGAFGVLESFPASQGLMSDRWRPNTVFVATAVILGVVGTVTSVRPGRSWAWLLCLLVVLTLFPTSQLSRPLWAGTDALHLFRFPWRFYSPATLFLSLFAATAFTTRKHWSLAAALLLVGLAAGLLATSYPPDDLHLNEVREEALTPEGVKASWATTAIFDEFRPRWVEERPSRVAWWSLASTSRETQIEQLADNSIERRYRVVSDRPVRLLVLLYYFPGWVVSVDGSPVEVEVTPRGTMALDLGAGDHVVEMRFDDTPPRQLGATLSWVGLVGLLILVLVGVRSKTDTSASGDKPSAEEPS